MPLEQVSHVFNSSLVCSAAVQEPSDGGPYKGFDLFRSRRLALTQQALQLDRAQQHAPELVRCLLGIPEAQDSAAGLLLKISRKQCARVARPRLPEPDRSA